MTLLTLQGREGTQQRLRGTKELTQGQRPRKHNQNSFTRPFIEY